MPLCVLKGFSFSVTEFMLLFATCYIHPHPHSKSIFANSSGFYLIAKFLQTALNIKIIHKVCIVAQVNCMSFTSLQLLCQADEYNVNNPAIVFVLCQHIKMLP